MINLKNHIKIAFGYFLLASIFGVVLRFFYSVDIPINYRFVVHTHSHIALLGWVYMALSTLLYKLYLAKINLDKKYKRIYWFTQLTLVGMLLSFPFTGYALFSILFSSLFLLESYWFTYFFMRHTPKILKKTNSYKCIQLALWFMVISSIGPWALGAIMTTWGPTSIWYRIAIYFYLHFQYNGWMILALVGVFFRVLELQEIKIAETNFKRFFYALSMGIVLSFLLSVLWTNPPSWVYVLGGLGALLQLVAFAVLLKWIITNNKKVMQLFSPFHKQMLLTVAFILGIKMLLQLATALPYIANLASTIIDFTIGYLHWCFLGVISISLFLFLDYFKLMILPKKAYFLYLTAFFLTEGFIFYKGAVQWLSLSLFDAYFNVLAVASILLPISLIRIMYRNFKLNKE